MDGGTTTTGLIIDSVYPKDITLRSGITGTRLDVVLAVV